LSLKGIDAGQPADTGLVELHDLARVSAFSVQSLDLAQLLDQGFPDYLKVNATHDSY